jgi:hypothetical protein
MTFKVGDEVVVTSAYANGTSARLGDKGIIHTVYAPGRTSWYEVKFPSTYGPRYFRLSKSNLRLYTSAVFNKNVKDMTTEELGRKVVEVATKLAKEHDWCNVVDEALIDMGLSEFMEPTERVYEVTVTVRIDGDRAWDDADYNDAVWDAVADGNYYDDKVVRKS